MDVFVLEECVSNLQPIVDTKTGQSLTVARGFLRCPVWPDSDVLAPSITANLCVEVVYQQLRVIAWDFV